MIQPALDGAMREDGEPALCEVGCIGRLTSLRRDVATAAIWSRCTASAASASPRNWRCARRSASAAIIPFAADLDEDQAGGDVDRTALLKAFRQYLEANELEADWESVSRADNAMLVNALSMMAPYGPAEKQALLEAPDLKTRAER